MSLQKRPWLWDLLCGAVLALFSFWVIWRFAQGTTPLRPDDYQWDSALFQVVGKLWADGLCPYVDIFDHKGPLLFLAQRIAYAFPQPRVALYVMESGMVSVSLWLGYALLRLRMGRGASLAGAVLMLAFWLPLMEYGNLCETHNMPWLMLALYLQTRYLDSDAREHPPLYALVYGLCFGASLMIRPNNGALIAAVTLGITLDLCVRGRWANILRNALALVSGVGICVLPFVVYFAARGAMDAFLYATWTFNLLYARSLEFLLDWQSLRNVLLFLTPALLCLGLTVPCWLKRERRLAIVLALSVAATLAVTLSGIGYAHYFMLYVPLVPFALYTAGRVSASNRSWRWPLAAVCLCFALITLRTTMPYANQHYLTAPTPEEAAREAAYDRMVAQIQAAIPPEERDQVAVCGLLVTDAELLLKTELHPVGRYCFLMEWHSRADNRIRQRFLQTLRGGQAKWLIYRQGGAGEELQNVMAESFTPKAVFSYDGTDYTLYRWKENEAGRADQTAKTISK